MERSSSFTNDEIKLRIENVYAKFVHDVGPDRISDWLVQEHVITTDQWQRIRQENPITEDRCRALLHHLFSTHHPRAFLVVRAALSEENHYLLEDICNQESERQVRVQPTRTVALSYDSNGHESTEVKQKANENNLSSELRTAHQEILHLKEKNQELENEVQQLRDANAQLKTKLKDVNGMHQSEGEKRSAQLAVPYGTPVSRSTPIEKHCFTLSTVQQFPSTKYTSDPVFVRTIKTKSAYSESEINGFTILNKELFVVRERSSEVEVYDSMKFSFSRRWNLEELIDPYDITSCNRNKCLYIFDFKNEGQSKEILRADVHGKLIKKWSTGDDYGRLSVADESSIILTVFKGNKLIVYSPCGKLMREINLSSADILYPYRAIELSSGHFMVSHGSAHGLHRVCVVDEYGKLKRSFGGESGNNFGQMNGPVDLSVDRNGFVMVADRENHRVLLLNKDLKFKREILSGERHALRQPRRILLDESNGRLFVADSKWDPKNELFIDGQILIFDIK